MNNSIIGLSILSVCGVAYFITKDKAYLYNKFIKRDNLKQDNLKQDNLNQDKDFTNINYSELTELSEKSENLDHFDFEIIN